MSSTYSSSLRIELIGTGDQAGTWGNTTNTNLGTLMESAVCGYVSVSVIAADQALTALNGAADQSRNAVIALTTTTGAAFNVYAPPAEKIYVIYNASSYTATIYNSTVLGNTTAAGTGVAIPAGKTVTVWSDGTNFATQNTHFPGVVTAATASPGTNTTQLATTAFVQAATGTLGTMSTQNADNITVTGGTINNTTIGASTATTVRGTIITATSGFSGNLTGNVTGNTSGSAGSLATTNWTITESGGVLYFAYGGVNKFKMTSAGALTAVGDITAIGTV
jgi:hypothetical protein